jgi:hypothetical protein
LEEHVINDKIIFKIMPCLLITQTLYAKAYRLIATGRKSIKTIPTYNNGFHNTLTG